MKHLTIDHMLLEKSWKKFTDNKQTVITMMVMFLLPVLTCIINLWSAGIALSDIKITALTTREEVFYFKYVEGVVTYGKPMGGWGYNESNVLINGGITWNSLIAIHWIVWGFLFGWNGLSPILCNIVIMCTAFVLLAVLVKPTYFQTLLIVVFNILYSQFTYYSLGTSPESFIYALIIVFVALACTMRRHLLHKKKRIFACIMGIVPGVLLLVLFVSQYYVLKLNPQQKSNIVNYFDEDIYADILDLTDGLSDYIKIDEDESSYDNTIVMLEGDYQNGKWMLTDWRYCYAMPKGIGINVCNNEYVEENFDDLKCRYLMTVAGGDIADLCKENGALEIYNNGTVAIYNTKERQTEILNTGKDIKDISDKDEDISVLVLGDSIFGLYRNQFGICEQLQEMLGGNVYNAAVGGTSAAWRDDITFPHQAYSLAMLSDCILQDNYAYLEHNVAEVELESIRYIQEPITLLKSMNYDELDYILICYGTNDYFSKVPIESNWPQSNKSYKNALTKGVEKLKKKCPSAEIMLCTPIYGNYESDKQLEGDSNTLDMGYGTLQNYVKAMKEVAEEQNVMFVDAYNELDINKDNWERYSRDGIHPSYRGSKLYAELIVKIIRK